MEPAALPGSWYLRALPKLIVLAVIVGVVNGYFKFRSLVVLLDVDGIGYIFGAAVGVVMLATLVGWIIYWVGPKQTRPMRATWAVFITTVVLGVASIAVGLFETSP